jgi:mono/diheme cytochrome c family protein
VSFRLSIRQLVRPAWLVPLLLLGLVLLPGCEDKYNENMVFPVRTDPVIRGPEEVNKLFLLVGEVTDPDPPGQLPLMSLKGIADPRNLFHLRAEGHEQPEKELKEKREQVQKCFFDPADLSAGQRSELQALLQESFGTPARPRLGAKAPAAAKQLERLRLDEETLKEGGRLYRLHCMQCHGLTGDGRGPTAKWVNPHPRDYRPGWFKFQSVKQEPTSRPPRRADLFRTIKFGVEGTTMPAHNLLPDAEIDAMVSYVIFLSIRGQVELEALQKIAKDGEAANVPKAFTGAGSGRVVRILKNWYESQLEENVIKPPPYTTTTSEELTASVQRGRALFDINCGKCHNDYGRRALFKMDDVGWGILVRPANLTAGVYRGGRRPIDLYWRIKSGINGAAMPPQALGPEQIWDVVNFLQVLPYPAMHKQHAIQIN